MSKVYTEAEQKLSRMFTCARAVAIWTVIAAHITIKSSDVLAQAYAAIGTVGVALFFMMAGYFYKKDPPVILLKKKTISVVLPWLVLGTVVWLGNTLLLSGEISVVQWLLWLIGYKTYLYYVVVLLICFVLFYFHNLVTLFVAIGTTLASLILTAMGCLTPVIETLHITNYLNAFNWVGFFALGMLLRRIQAEKLYGWIRSMRWVWMALSVLTTVALVIFKVPTNYFTYYGWAYELICAFGILSLCTWDALYNKWTLSISRFSYAIYLMHMLFVGVLAKVYLLHPVVSALANTLVLMVTWLVLVCGKYIAQKIKLGTVYNYAIGLRVK